MHPGTYSKTRAGHLSALLFWFARHGRALTGESPEYAQATTKYIAEQQGFACSFLQIPPHDGHPCCSAMYFVVACAYSGLSPVRARPWRANLKTTTLLGGRFCCVGIFLFSRAVASQVSSAPMSLTTVFGMGTGGPSSSSTPTVLRTSL